MHGTTVDPTTIDPGPADAEGSTRDAVLVLLVLATFLVTPLEQRFAWRETSACACAVIAGIGVWQHSRQVTSVGIAGALWFAGLLVLPWPASLLAFLLALAAAFRLLPSSLVDKGWYRRGGSSRNDWVVAAGFVVVSSAALVLWRFTTDYDLSQYAKHVPETGLPMWVILIGLWPFALLNALAEEFLFRGVLQHALESIFRSQVFVVAAQGLAFGFLHYVGFPGGWIGAGLAVTYGIMMGIVRARTGGLFLAVAAHVLADVTIYTMVVLMVLSPGGSTV